jgi:hypothetical protein
MRQRFLLATCLLVAAPVAAQPEVGVGADLVSRYVWRGYDFGESASVQPALSVTAGPLKVGLWGSYAIGDASANEIDLTVSYTAGPVTVGVADYTFPPSPLFNVNNFDGEDANGDPDPGSHFIEPFVSVAVPGGVGLYAGTFVYNDEAYSTYLEVNYGTEVGAVGVSVALGSVLALDLPAGGSTLYGTEDPFALTNLSVKVARSIPLTEQFSLPVFGQFVVNPYDEQGFLLFGVSL